MICPWQREYSNLYSGSPVLSAPSSLRLDLTCANSSRADSISWVLKEREASWPTPAPGRPAVRAAAGHWACGAARWRPPALVASGAVWTNASVPASPSSGAHCATRKHPGQHENGDGLCLTANNQLINAYENRNVLVSFVTICGHKTHVVQFSICDSECVWPGVLVGSG